MFFACSMKLPILHAMNTVEELKKRPLVSQVNLGVKMKKKNFFFFLLTHKIVDVRFSCYTVVLVKVVLQGGGGLVDIHTH